MRRREAKLDRDMAALLAARAFVEIRSLAREALRSNDSSHDEVLDRIRFLADVCHNMPGVARPPFWQPSRWGGSGTSDRAMAERPLSWTWNTSSPKGQAWMLSHIEEERRAWNPPPPLPEPRKDPLPMTLWQRIGLLLRRWPVRAPLGRKPLPAEANILKALDTESICALHDEARRLRLGLGTGGSWLRGHLARDGVHYLLPDPAVHYWPGNPNGRGGSIEWWQCTALLQMYDGQQVSSMIAVLPETFAALASTLPRREQLRLVHRVRSIERDAYLWGRNHEAACAPQLCGYVPEATDTGPPTT